MSHLIAFIHSVAEQTDGQALLAPLRQLNKSCRTDVDACVQHARVTFLNVPMSTEKRIDRPVYSSLKHLEVALPRRCVPRREFSMEDLSGVMACLKDMVPPDSLERVDFIQPCPLMISNFMVMFKNLKHVSIDSIDALAMEDAIKDVLDHPTLRTLHLTWDSLPTTADFEKHIQLLSAFRGELSLTLDEELISYTGILETLPGLTSFALTSLCFMNVNCAMDVPNLPDAVIRLPHLSRLSFMPRFHDEDVQVADTYFDLLALCEPTLTHLTMPLTDSLLLPSNLVSLELILCATDARDLTRFFNRSQHLHARLETLVLSSDFHRYAPFLTDPDVLHVGKFTQLKALHLDLEEEHVTPTALCALAMKLKRLEAFSCHMHVVDDTFRYDWSPAFVTMSYLPCMKRIKVNQRELSDAALMASLKNPACVYTDMEKNQPVIYTICN